MKLPGDIFPPLPVSTLTTDHLSVSNNETTDSMNNVVAVVAEVEGAVFDPMGNHPEYKVDGKTRNQMIDYQTIVNIIIEVIGETVVDLTNVAILPRGDNFLLLVVLQEVILLGVAVKVHPGVEVLRKELVPHLDLVGVVVVIFDLAVVVKVAAVSHVVVAVVVVDHVVGDQKILSLKIKPISGLFIFLFFFLNSV